MDRNRLNNLILKACHISFIPTKFGHNPASSLESMSFEAIVEDARHTTDEGHPTITIAHNEPMAQVS